MNITRSIALAALLALSTSSAMAASRKGSTPPEMVGKWDWTSVSMTTYEDKATGSYDGGGMHTTLTFTRDGRYKFYFYVKMRTYNLVNEASTASEGTVTWSDGQFKLHPTKGHYLGWFNGRQKTNRDMTAAERRKNTNWWWKWDSKNGKRVLMMGMSPNILSQYKRDS